jgi:LacI family transcriptional regulator
MRNKSKPKRIALLGMPILQEVGNLLNVALARHAVHVGNWKFVINGEDSVANFKHLRSLDCDGALVRVTSPATRREVRKTPFPVVNISSWLEDPGVPTVRTDWHRLGKLGAEHLLEKGFRQFGCVIVPGGWYIQQRFSAFAETVRAQGCELSLFHLLTTQPEVSLPITRKEQRRFMDWVRRLRPPAALLLTDDWDAPTLMDACRQAGQEIPRDLVVLSLGIHSEVMAQCHPALSGAQENLEMQGQIAINLLENLMTGKEPPLAPINVPPLEVRERASTATMAIGDRKVAHAVEFIRAHGFEPIKVGDVVQHSQISRGTLERRFKQVTGLSPHDYLLQNRVGRAQELLVSSPDFSLTSIAHQSGFRDRPELNRVFKRLLRQSPAAWQQDQRRAQGLIHQSGLP